MKEKRRIRTQSVPLLLRIDEKKKKWLSVHFQQAGHSLSGGIRGLLYAYIEKAKGKR